MRVCRGKSRVLTRSASAQGANGHLCFQPSSGRYLAGGAGNAVCIFDVEGEFVMQKLEVTPVATEMTQLEYWLLTGLALLCSRR